MDSISFVDGKEDSTTEKFPSLIFLSARLVYYLNLNFMYNLEKTVVDGYNCDCYNFSSCRKINGIRDYCDLCSLSVKHSPYENEKNYRIKHLIEKHLSLVNDFKEYKYVKIHVGDYSSKNINFKDGTYLEWSFYSYVFESLYIKKQTFF